MKLISLIGLIVFGGGQVLAQRPIEYLVSLPSPQTQTVEIECRLFDLVGETLELKLPVWRPGKYEVLDPAGTLYNFQVSDANGKSLSFKKMDKSTWRIDLNGSNEVVASYTIYANSLSDRTRHVDDTHAFLSGSAVFVYTPSRRSRPLKVRFQVPESWEIATGLRSFPGDGREFGAENYDTLVDSPFELGLQKLSLIHI